MGVAQVQVEQRDRRWYVREGEYGWRGLGKEREARMRLSVLASAGEGARRRGEKGGEGERERAPPSIMHVVGAPRDCGRGDSTSVTAEGNSLVAHLGCQLLVGLHRL